MGDFNLDGKSHLVTANQDSNNVSVLLNGCTSNTPPTISALSVTRAAGSPAGISQIATVNDIQDAESALVVTATPLSGSGVTPA